MKTQTLKSQNGQKIVNLHENNEEITIELSDLNEGNRTLDIEVHFYGENTFCRVIGRINSTQTDQKTWNIRQIFHGKNQKGQILVRGVAENQAFVEINASATLKNGSSGAEAEIKERIILFDKAKAKALPVLRVETDDVAAASHAASVAPVEKEQILYLQSRGISKNEAQKMIKEGFLRK